MALKRLSRGRAGGQSERNMNCGFHIERKATANSVLAADECAFVTYGVLPGTIGAGVLTQIIMTTAYFGPGDKIPPNVAGAGPLTAKLVGGVVFKNC